MLAQKTATNYLAQLNRNQKLTAETQIPAGLVIATKGGFVWPGPNQWVENEGPEHLRSAGEGSLQPRLPALAQWGAPRADPHTYLQNIKQPTIVINGGNDSHHLHGQLLHSSAEYSPRGVRVSG